MANLRRKLDKEHDREVSDFDSTITAVERRGQAVLRFSAHLPGSAANPQWCRPNVAVRLHLPEAAGGVTRVYTIRSYDQRTEVAIIDVVLHGSQSPMMQWCATVQVGDTLVITGPRAHFQVPSGKRAVLFLDDTAIPAAAALFEHWDPANTGTAWILSEDEYAVAELPKIPGLQVYRVASDEGRSLASCARNVPQPQNCVVWGAGERDEMREIRRYFTKEVGLAKDAVAVFGYWKLGTSTTMVDRARRRRYLAHVADSGALAEFDDFSVPI